MTDWHASYKKQIKLAGIVYFHRISDNRMTQSPLLNLGMFAKLCGNDASRNVILTTTMWSRVKEETGALREAELTGTYWKGMIESGSRAMRFKDSFISAWDIIDTIVQRDPAYALLLQEELVDIRRRLSETEAGVALYNTLQNQLAKQKEILRTLRDEAAMENDEQLVRELTEQYTDMQNGLQATFNQLKTLKIPFGRRIRFLLTFQKPRSVSFPQLRIHLLICLPICSHSLCATGPQVSHQPFRSWNLSLSLSEGLAFAAERNRRS
jgi:hypothetical protein